MRCLDFTNLLLLFIKLFINPFLPLALLLSILANGLQETFSIKINFCHNNSFCHAAKIGIIW